MALQRPAPAKTVPLSCPFCGSGVVNLIDVSEDLKSAKVRCPSCHRESILAIPPVR